MSIRVVIAAAALVSLLSCGHPRSVMAQEKPQPALDPVPDRVAGVDRGAQEKPQPALDPVPISRDADDFARFIAGLPGKSGSPYSVWEQSTAWQNHRRLVDAAWEKAERERLTGLREFQQHELDGAGLRSRAVFYPFGGPDALTAVLFFPHSPLYVIVGLEPAGTLPTPKELKKKDLSKYLGGLRASTANEVGHSFFVTREMDRQYRGQVTDGVLVPILDLLVRTGHTILGYRYIRLDEDGNVVERPANSHTPGKIGNKGIDIEFRSDSGPALPAQRLLYLSVNLSNERLRLNPQFTAWAANNLKDVVTLLKATSYMPHHPEFSAIRALIFSQSAAVLQDDSGIPYRAYRAHGWNVQLFGGYQRPYGSFRWLQQADLKKAYEAGPTEPLPMAIGYGYRRVPSNLQLARKATQGVAGLTSKNQK